MANTEAKTRDIVLLLMMSCWVLMRGSEGLLGGDGIDLVVLQQDQKAIKEPEHQVQEELIASLHKQGYTPQKGDSVTAQYPLSQALSQPRKACC